MGITALALASSRGHMAVVKTLLANNAEPDRVDCMGRNALHLACKSGHAAVARLLMEASPELVAMPDNIGQSSLHYVISNSRHLHKFEMLELLLRSTSNPNVADNFGRTPLRHAA